MRTSLILLLSVGLAGCAGLTAEPWPKEGSGGFAELRPINDERLAALADRLGDVADKGAGARAAADFAAAESLLTRTRRETEAGLDHDADADAAALDRILVRVETAVASRDRRPIRSKDR